MSACLTSGRRMNDIEIMRPKVSVALPVYNTDETQLRECIQSILSQTFTDFELIIYNDASTLPHVDSCIRSYDDLRIRYYTSSHNIGITGTRNAIIELARGEYIAIADHDDISLPQRFEQQVAILDSMPEVGIVSSLVQCFPVKHVFNNYELDDDIKALLFSSCSILHPASMIRTSVLMEHGIRYEEAFSPAEDYMLWCRCMPYTQFYTIQEVLLLYRIHEHNTSRLQLHEMKEATRRIQSIMKKDNPMLYALSLLQYERKQYKTLYIRLFGCIPFLKRKKKGRYVCWYLFYYIPLLKYKVW